MIEFSLKLGEIVWNVVHLLTQVESQSPLPWSSEAFATDAIAVPKKSLMVETCFGTNC
jgi:hypothetical protein